MVEKTKTIEYSIQKSLASTFEQMKSEFKYKNKLQAPRLEKITISVATGREMKQDKKINEFILGKLNQITGQRGVETKAKKAIASFKTRIGDKIGIQVTLRGRRMWGFLEKFLQVSLPRTKDFRGLKSSSVDSTGNLTIGLKEDTIFPEIRDADLKDRFGLAITFTTTTKSRPEAIKFFEIMGIPFKKEAK